MHHLPDLLLLAAELVKALAGRGLGRATQDDADRRMAGEGQPQRLEPLRPFGRCRIVGLFAYRSRYWVFSRVGIKATKDHAPDEQLGIPANVVPHALPESVTTQQFDQAVDKLTLLSINIVYMFNLLLALLYVATVSYANLFRKLLWS